MDASTGTTGNDTFNATGATLSSQDTVTGGAGTDKLVILDTTKSFAAGSVGTFSGVEALELTTNGGVGAFATSSTAAAGVKQVVTVTTSGISIIGPTAASITVNGQTYTDGTVTGTTLEAINEDILALAKLAFSNSVTFSDANNTDGLFTITAIAEGQVIPAITFATTNSANETVATATSTTTPGAQIISASGASTGLQTITLAHVGDSANTNDTYAVQVNGNSVTVYTGKDHTAAATAMASQINALHGSAIASATLSTITIQGASGVVLPTIGATVATGGTDNGVPTVTLANLRSSTTAATAATSDVQYDASGFADTLKISSQGDVNLKAAATAAVDTSTTSGVTTISGGKTAKVVATKAVTIAGAALTDVEATTATSSAVVAIGASTGTTSVTPKLVTAKVTGGSDVLVTDYTGGASSKTLTAVTITGTGDTTVTLEGDALTTLTVGKQTTATAITITNSATAEHDLVLNVADSGASGQVVTVTNNTAKSAVVNAAGTNNFIKLDGDASLIKVTTTGAGKMSLDLDGSNNGVTSFDGSASTGALTLSNIAAATISVKTGSGNDTLTTIHTAKATVDTGNGDDALTINATLAAASTVNLGAGDDRVLKGSSGSVATDTTADVTSVDGGAGNDVLSADLITAGNGDQFINFETLGLVSATIDATLLTKSTITGLELLAGGGTYTGVTNSQALKVATLGMSGTTTLTMSGLSGLADGYTINFTEANAAARTAAPTSANVAAGTVATSGIENYTINSGGTFTWNSIDLGANTSANTVTVTGASNLDLTFASNFGSTTAPRTGVSLIDGSAATGKLAITTTNVVPATAGFTVKGGSGNDTITTAGEVITVTLGAGFDIVDVGANKITATATATAAEVVSELVTITDFAVGDKIDFSGTVTLATTPVAAKTDVTSATSLLTALNLAVVGGGNGNTEVNWFIYAGDTYILYDLTSSTGAGDVDTNDVVVKITGIHDFARSTLSTEGVFTYVG